MVEIFMHILLLVYLVKIKSLINLTMDIYLNKVVPNAILL